MSSRRPSPAVPQKRAVAIKRLDGDPLTRADIQYDVLYHIFHDTYNAFTDPYPSDDTPVAKLCFRDLYVKTILHSPKATKGLKDRMIDSSAFSEDFGMLALLVNVGRVNTTMSFFPEMKTAIRTYHPVPALQRTTGNLQDAPRIKHILKSTVLPNETATAPSTPADILARVKGTHVPSTTVTNLIFVLANHSTSIGHHHFSGTLDFLDLFIRENVSSLTRARAFLWLCFHYLESASPDNEDDYDGEGSGNPFVDTRRGDAPTFVFLSESEVSQENVDPEKEKSLGEKLMAQRTEILKAQGTKESNKVQGQPSAAGSIMGDDEHELVDIIDDAKSKGKRATVKSTSSATAKEKKAAASAARRLRLKEEKAKERDTLRRAPALESDEEDGPVDPSTSHNQYPKHQYTPRPPPSEPRRHLYGKNSTETSSDLPGTLHHERYSPYQSPVAGKPQSTMRRYSSNHPRRVSLPPRSFLQQAWHIITTTDPLMDSDSEIGDEQVREDYMQRLCAINILRCKEPTPEPERTK